MMLPESVMKVMPMATQPMNDIVVISDTRLTVDRNPGVLSANATSATNAMSRIASSARWCRLGGSHCRRPSSAEVVLSGCMASARFCEIDAQWCDRLGGTPSPRLRGEGWG
jgi:hypothetical protein